MPMVLPTSTIRLLFLGTLLQWLFWSCNGQEKNPPNVVILFTDDQGTLDATCYGADDLYTPNIDRLSNSWTRFTRAYAHAVCYPSRVALLTGRHSQRFGIREWTQNNPHDAEKGINLLLEEVTIATSGVHGATGPNPSRYYHRLFW